LCFLLQHTLSRGSADKRSQCQQHAGVATGPLTRNTEYLLISLRPANAAAPCVRALMRDGKFSVNSSPARFDPVYTAASLTNTACFPDKKIGASWYVTCSAGTRCPLNVTMVHSFWTSLADLALFGITIITSLLLVMCWPERARASTTYGKVSLK